GRGQCARRGMANAFPFGWVRLNLSLLPCHPRGPLMTSASPVSAKQSPEALAAAVADGNRRALARAITLIESTRPDHRANAIRLLDALPTDREALRIGLSGTPGVGKSTLIEAFGLM